LRIRLSLLLATAVGASLAGLLPIAPAAAATPIVSFSRIQYDSPGVDDRSAASLHAEYVVLANNTGGTINLAGWSIRDKANHVYTFRGNVYIGSRQWLMLHTGTGTDTVKHRYWNSGAYIWNNEGDQAWLRTGRGVQVDSCAWGRGNGVTYC
jgi:hypothetical protein